MDLRRKKSSTYRLRGKYALVSRTERTSMGLRCVEKWARSYRA